MPSATAGWTTTSIHFGSKPLKERKNIMTNETTDTTAMKNPDEELATRFGTHLGQLGSALQGLAAFYGLPDENS